MESVGRVQILDNGVCISDEANALRKDMNPFFSPIQLCVNRTELFNLGRATSMYERKLEINATLLRLKNDSVLNSARSKEIDWIYACSHAFIQTYIAIHIGMSTTVSEDYLPSIRNTFCYLLESVFFIIVRF